MVGLRDLMVTTEYPKVTAFCVYADVQDELSVKVMVSGPSFPKTQAMNFFYYSQLCRQLAAALVAFAEGFGAADLGIKDSACGAAERIKGQRLRRRRKNQK